jgi:hypothetical protein
MRNTADRIQLAALITALDDPDPASFHSQVLGKDVPAAWLPAATRTAVDRLADLTGATRDRAALDLAAHLATRDGPVVTFDTKALGTVVGPRLGCRVWNGVDSDLDLAALCLRTPNPGAPSEVEARPSSDPQQNRLEVQHASLLFRSAPFPSLAVKHPSFRRSCPDWGSCKGGTMRSPGS